MGDGGLGLGAALDRLATLDSSFRPFKLESVSLGPSYDQAAIDRTLNRVSLPKSYSTHTYKDTDKLSKTVADDLANGCAVCLFTGPMEYGPRALGNRTILYQPTDPSAIEWLNQRLDRTEFMPFAPVTLAEDAAECYEGYDPERCPAAEFMTVTFNCTDTMKKRSPGTVHVDGTARPQIIYEEQNPLYYNIISSYKDITGIPTLINTSFNRHGEPIVCKPAEAIRSFVNSDIETLVAESTVIRNESAESFGSETESPDSGDSS
jgi:carbamoyltransferase